MLTLPQNSQPYRVVGIDPGTKLLGVAALDLDLATGEVALAEVRTFDAEQLMRAYPHVIQVHGSRMARLMALEETLSGFFNYLQPHAIVSESPYMGRFPQAYAALTECVSGIRRAVYRYDQFLPLLMVDPMTAKLAVGVTSKGRPKVGRGKPGKTGLVKEDVRVGLLQQPILNLSGADLNLIDEHSVDAIAVAYSHVRYLQQYLIPTA